MLCPARPWAHPWRPGERRAPWVASAPLSLCVGGRSRRACEVAAFDEPAKPWVIAIGIPFGILGQPDEMHVAQLDGAVEPLSCLPHSPYCLKIAFGMNA